MTLWPAVSLVFMPALARTTLTRTPSHHHVLSGAAAPLTQRLRCHPRCCSRQHHHLQIHQQPFLHGCFISIFLPHTRTNRHTPPLALALRCCSSALSAVSIRNLTLKVGPGQHHPLAVMAASFSPAASPMLAPHAPYLSCRITWCRPNLPNFKFGSSVYACM